MSYDNKIVLITSLFVELYLHYENTDTLPNYI